MGIVLGKIISWLLVALACLTAFACFSDSFIGGLLAIAAAVFFCPLSWKMLRRFAAQEVPTGAFIILALVTYFAGTGMAISNFDDKKQAVQQGFANLEDYQAANKLGLDAASYAKHLDGLAAVERQKTEEAKATQAKVASACRQDLQCWADENQFDAIMACKPAVQKLAKYDYEWTDGITSPIFSRLAWSEKKSGMIIYFGDEIKFQNGLGNFVRHTYACTFDPVSKLAVNVSAESGRL
ncbi:hypothetical protein [Pseudomonas sp. CCOS 191]|uniref:hypothetical protein n=1 Tax=Pseudomonas sp. CCOS 191 TaxID=1649877 RepID=UPI0006246E6B|nr:hypothetical protein [Pseudomonas sp. CCOS 191]CRI56750.1 putative membrane protein [Pseudomonas sp. CCOS 191]